MPFGMDGPPRPSLLPAKGSRPDSQVRHAVSVKRGHTTRARARDRVRLRISGCHRNDSVIEFRRSNKIDASLYILTSSILAPLTMLRR